MHRFYKNNFNNDNQMCKLTYIGLSYRLYEWKNAFELLRLLFSIIDLNKLLPHECRGKTESEKIRHFKD